MQNTGVKEEAHRLLDNLPDSTTWEDLMYRIYVLEAIQEGLRDSDAGKTIDVEKGPKKVRIVSIESLGEGYNPAMGLSW